MINRDPNKPLFFDAPAVTSRVLYSLQHLYTLRARGDFPQHIKLGPGRRVWAVEDVLSWMQSKIDNRAPPALHAKDRIEITLDDRFIDKRELKSLVPYSETRIWELERSGQFPLRISLGQKRAAWLEREIIAWLHSKKPEAPAA